MGRPARVTRQQVLDAARAVFSERGYDGATLASIAARLRLSPAALLRHAANKAALFAAAMANRDTDLKLPAQFLSTVPDDADPRPVLRRLATGFVPFAEARLGEAIALWMSGRSPLDGGPRAGQALLRHLPAQPRRGLAMVEAYFRRATRAGVLDMRDPRAAALGFMGALHAYVFLHRVLRIFDPPLPLDRYLDTLLDVWTRGATRPRRTARRPRP